MELSVYVLTHNYQPNDHPYLLLWALQIHRMTMSVHPLRLLMFFSAVLFGG
ncbi:MAG: hypothetical protein M1596_03300 [Firmicutes bacterium]|nr:hypothetical protein [Bacillota bacterium]